MGIQQKILIGFAMIVVIALIVFGFRLFRHSEGGSNLDAIRNDLADIGSKAVSYYHKPKILTGGGYSYADLVKDQDGLQKLFFSSQNQNGTFQIIDDGDDQCLIVHATGKTDFDNDGQLLTLDLRWFSDSVRISVLSH